MMSEYLILRSFFSVCCYLNGYYYLNDWLQNEKFFFFISNLRYFEWCDICTFSETILEMIWAAITNQQLIIPIIFWHSESKVALIKFCDLIKRLSFFFPLSSFFFNLNEKEFLLSFSLKMSSSLFFLFLAYEKVKDWKESLMGINDL